MWSESEVNPRYVRAERGRTDSPVATKAAVVVLQSLMDSLHVLVNGCLGAGLEGAESAGQFLHLKVDFLLVFSSDANSTVLEVAITAAKVLESCVDGQQVALQVVSEGGSVTTQLASSLFHGVFVCLIRLQFSMYWEL